MSLQFILWFPSFPHARTHEQRWFRRCVAHIRARRFHHPLAWFKAHVYRQCAVYLTFRAVTKSSRSHQMLKPIVCTIPLHNAFPIFAADVVVQNNDRPEIAEVIMPSHTKTHSHFTETTAEGGDVPSSTELNYYT